MKPLIKTVPALVGLSFFSLAHAQQESKRPNIIFILADDMGYGGLSCYGNKLVLLSDVRYLLANTPDIQLSGITSVKQEDFRD